MTPGPSSRSCWKGRTEVPNCADLSMTRGSRLPGAARLLPTRSGGNRPLVFRPACSYYSCDMNYIVIALAGLLLTGCTTALTTKTLTSSQDGQTVSVKLGQVIAVSLPSNRTTGYGWVERAPSESVLERDGEPTYAQDASSAKLAGGGGTESWRFSRRESRTADAPVGICSPVGDERGPGQSDQFPGGRVGQVGWSSSPGSQDGERRASARRRSDLGINFPNSRRRKFEK